MGPARTFPKPLVAALGVPIVVFLTAHLFGKNVGGAMFLLACGAELLAVPAALVYLVRGGYLTIFNVVLTLVAAIPAGVLVAFAWTLKYGHFHI